MNISDNDIAGINEAWDKLLGLTGVRASSFKMGDFLAEPAASTADITFYVNPASGDDNNDGSATRPFRTLAKAAKEVPALQANNVTINLSAGTHTVDSELMIGGIQLSQNIDFKIQGAGFQLVTPTSGVASGTFTSASDWTLNMTGAGWTASDLIGKFVRITSGSLIGEYFPIAGNTTTAIEVPKKVLTAAATATFELVEPTTTIQFSGTGTILVSTIPANRSTNYTTSTSIRGVGPIFESLKISSTSTAAHIIKATPSAGLVFNRCTGRARDDYSFVRAEGGQLSISKCYLATKGVSSSNTRTVWNGTSTNNHTYSNQNVLDGLSGTGQFAYGIYSLSNTSLSETIVQGYTAGSCSAVYQTGPNLSIATSLIRNSTVGITTSSQCKNMSFNNTKITNISSVGVDIIAPCYVQSSGGLAIDTCTSHGIKCGQGYTILNFAGTTTIINCGGFGVTLTNPSFPKACAYNALRLMTATMSGNTSGDMTLDGTTATSLATLTADPDKTIVDSTLFNRLSID